jgi:2-polyprenyl-6-methoxyphenol hydroxylase-like FAD-dependent oxidoreductase
MADAINNARGVYGRPVVAPFQSPPADVPVLILGCGVAGATLAALLSRAGIPCLVLEREAIPRARFRGEILQPYGVAILGALGFLEFLREEEAATVREFHLHFPCGDGAPESWALLSPRNGLPGYALTCPHHTLYGAMRKRVLGDPLIELHAGVRATSVRNNADGTWSVEVSGHGGHREYRASVLVGADGAQSLLHRFPGFGTVRKPSQTYLIGAVIEASLAAMENFLFIADHDWVVYFFPLGRSRARLAMEVGVDFLGSQKGHLEEIGLRVCIEALDRFGYPLHDCKVVERMQVVSCPNVRSRNGVAGGACLVGDALGTVDPITGHGMTIACDDAVTLAWILREYFAARKPSTHALEGLPWKSQYRSLLERFSDQMVCGLLEQSPTALQQRRQIVAWYTMPDEPLETSDILLEPLRQLNAEITQYLGRSVALLKPWGVGASNYG